MKTLIIRNILIALAGLSVMVTISSMLTYQIMQDEQKDLMTTLSNGLCTIELRDYSFLEQYGIARIAMLIALFATNRRYNKYECKTSRLIWIYIVPLLLTGIVIGAQHYIDTEICNYVWGRK